MRVSVGEGRADKAVGRELYSRGQCVSRVLTWPHDELSPELVDKGTPAKQLGLRRCSITFNLGGMPFFRLITKTRPLWLLS